MTRTVTPQALVSFRGNHYSIPPGLGGAAVAVRHRLGADTLRIVTAGGATVAVHHRALDGAGRVIRDDGHVAALEGGAGRVHHGPALHPQDPPSAFGGGVGRSGTTARPARDGAHVVIDLSAYAATAARLDRAPTSEPEEG
ncbi:Mu transposase domain-containing protein [Amycolatopsis vastitatis]|uniref:Mu transposase domain-containing protein n=1 Tax=Amycolatopsis vastitatis TaxID=1905142 RepID=UPI00196A4DDD|nr:hypothetical protein [Amycolatopsis vastitatis]